MTFGSNISKESILAQIQSAGEASFDEIEGIDIETKREFLNELVKDGAIHFVHDDARFSYVFRTGKDPSLALITAGFAGTSRRKSEPKDTKFVVGRAYIDAINKTGVKYYIGKYRVLWLEQSTTDVLLFLKHQDDFYCFLDNGTDIVFYDSYDVRGFVESRKADLNRMRLNDIKASVEHKLPVNLDNTIIEKVSIGEVNNHNNRIFDADLYGNNNGRQGECITIYRYKGDKYVCMVLEYGYDSYGHGKWKLTDGVNITKVNGAICYKPIKPMKLSSADMGELSDGTFIENEHRTYRWQAVRGDIQSRCFQIKFGSDDTWRTVSLINPKGRQYRI